MNKLIFNSIAEALDYSKRNYASNNIIKSLETDKVVAGKCSMQSYKNPVLYVITESHRSEAKLEKKIFPAKYKFSKTLTGFDQL